MKNRSLRERLVIFCLVSGIICFGFIFPDSFSDHNKILHFSAHFGMSFLILSICYAFCNIQFAMSRTGSHIISILITLMIGCLYKYMEISSQGIAQHFELSQLLALTGCYTSMSQNLAGIFAGMFIIHYFFGKRFKFHSSRSLTA